MKKLKIDKFGHETCECGADLDSADWRYTGYHTENAGEWNETAKEIYVTKCPACNAIVKTSD